ncbi:hypothetical protein JL720_6129 [Aureococcus anophagefferens]|nr:hypothetical protein JL720_6129 [Aureococcus anophagefferens]
MWRWRIAALLAALLRAVADDAAPACAVPPDRVDDDYCDCPVDGGDEPHTSACASAALAARPSFACAGGGAGSAAFLPASRVGDGVCDCCDGADEPAGFCGDDRAGAPARPRPTRRRPGPRRPRARGRRAEPEGAEAAGAEAEAVGAEPESEAAPEPDADAVEAEGVEAEGAEAEGAEAEAVEAEAESEAAPEPDADAVEAEGVEAEGAEAEGAEAEAVEAEAESEAAPEPGTEAVEADAAADSEAEPERPDADADADADAALDEPAPEYEQTVELDGGGEDYDAYGDDYDFRDDYGDGDYGSNSFAGLDDEDFPDDEYGDIPDDVFPDDDYKSRRYDDDDFDYGKSYEPADPRLDVDGHADPDKGYVSAAQKKALKKLEGALRDLEEEQRRKERRSTSATRSATTTATGAIPRWVDARLGDYQRSTKHANNVTATLVYEHGEHCWNGPSRSLAVTLVCGAETGILDVDEPSTCVYAATVETPAVCVDADAPDVDCAGYKPAFALFDGLDSPKKRKKGARKLLKKAKAALASFFGRD